MALYRRSEDGFEYEEAWYYKRRVFLHRGIVGDVGETNEFAVGSAKRGKELLAEKLADAETRGFVPIPMEAHARLIVEYPIEGFGNDADLERIEALGYVISEIVGWHGLGLCDGHSWGSGTMEVCCFVVDYEIAKTVITEKLVGTEFADYSRIYNEDA